jgi:hypothetical protein
LNNRQLSGRKIDMAPAQGGNLTAPKRAEDGE